MLTVRMAAPVSAVSLRGNAFLRAKRNFKKLWNVLHAHLHIRGALQVITWTNTLNPVLQSWLYCFPLHSQAGKLKLRPVR